MGSPKKGKPKKTFDELAADAGIKPPAVQLLVDNDYDSVAAIATISTDELNKLDLSLGQKGMLRAWVDKLAPPTPKKAASAKPTATEGGATAGTSAETVTLGTLRSEEGLDKKILRRMRALGLDSDDSNDEDEDVDKLEKSRRGKKSGRVRTADDSVKHKTLWPQMHIHRPGEDKPPSYHTLTQEEFVYGFMCDIEDCRDENKKRRLWLRLQELMMDAMYFGWEAERGFHGVFLQNIEQGRMDWLTDITMLKTQYLLAPLSKQATNKTAEFKSKTTASTYDRKERYDPGHDHGPNAGPLFCVPFQTGACKLTGEGHDSQRGPVKHVCAFCLKSAGKLCMHSEESCIRKTKATGDNN